MTNKSEAKRLFAEMVSREDEEINLAETALLFAKEIEYSDLDTDKYLRTIDLMGNEIKERIRDKSDPFLLIDEINRYLFTEEGFKGNETEYYDPRNSFLNDVLDRKTGIPITLSVLYIDVAAKAGLSISGVGFPSHFIVKYSGLGEEILIDPFNKGKVLSESDCQEMLDRIYGGGIKLKSDLLQSPTRKQILARMLHNLKNIYINFKDFLKALSVVDMLLVINPYDTSQLRDRGLIYYKLECFVQALYDLETYLRYAPKAEDARAIRSYILTLQELAAKIS